MKNNHNSSAPSLKDIQKSLDANQQLNAKMQGDVKGGCSSCQDIRRPPSADDLRAWWEAYRANR